MNMRWASELAYLHWNHIRKRGEKKEEFLIPLYSLSSRSKVRSSSPFAPMSEAFSSFVFLFFFPFLYSERWRWKKKHDSCTRKKRDPARDCGIAFSARSVHFFFEEDIIPMSDYFNFFQPQSHRLKHGSQQKSRLFLDYNNIIILLISIHFCSGHDGDDLRSKKKKFGELFKIHKVLLLPREVSIYPPHPRYTTWRDRGKSWSYILLSKLSLYSCFLLTPPSSSCFCLQKTYPSSSSRVIYLD